MRLTDPLGDSCSSRGAPQRSPFRIRLAELEDLDALEALQCHVGKALEAPGDVVGSRMLGQGEDARVRLVIWEESSYGSDLEYYRYISPQDWVVMNIIGQSFEMIIS